MAGDRACRVTDVPYRLFTRGSWSETRRVIGIFHKETVGGAILLVAASVALVWANSPWAASYTALTHLPVGTDALGLHLRLSLEGWSADGLLAIFFVVVGLELKREFVAGDLRDPGRAAPGPRASCPSWPRSIAAGRDRRTASDSDAGPASDHHHPRGP